MPSKYQIISEMAAQQTLGITANASMYTAFLETAAQNYKYPFRDQILIHAQKPTATACAGIEVWNKLGRWVNKGTKGIALLADNNLPYKLRYVFDVSDTNSYAGREISLWKMARRFEPEVSEALQNSFGEVEHTADFGMLVSEVSALAVQDNLSDYLYELNHVKDGSLLEELDELNTEVWLRGLLKSSVAYMALARCGYDAHSYFSLDDFTRVIDFNTPETISVLGSAASDISEMLLREIGETVRNLQKAEKNQIRTFENKSSARYNADRNRNNERSNEHGTDLHPAGRLPDSRPDSTGEPEDREIWNAAQKLPDEPPEQPIYWSASVRQAEPAPGGDRQASLGNDGDAHAADEAGAGRDGATESPGSDEVGGADEQHPLLSGGDSPDRADLQLIVSLPSEEEQQNSIAEAEAEKASAFTISQEDIDAILTRGSGISQGKYRIYEQYLKQEGAAENIEFLKNEYGWGGAYPAALVNGVELDESHDGKGIKIGKGSITKPDASMLLKWNKVEKRIGELIEADRYLNHAEKDFYPEYRRQETDRKARGQIAQEFRSIIYDYNDYVEQLGEKDKQLNLYYLSDCWQSFSIGQKLFHAREVKGEFVLP